MSGSSIASDSSDHLSDIYLPNKCIGAQDLVAGNYTLAGFLRKRAPINKLPGAKKIFPWGQRFIVLHRGCLYSYKSETDKKPCGSFSLFGYNKVFRAGEVLPSEAPWAFKLCHVYPTYKTYFFSAASEADMKEWMKQMKLEMMRANRHSMPRTNADGGSGSSDDNMSYNAIEEAIYDAGEFKPVPQAPKAPLEDEDSEDDYNDVTDVTFRELPKKPIVAKRPLPRPNPSLGAIKNELKNLNITKKPDDIRMKKRLPGDGRETAPFHRDPLPLPRDGGSPTMPPDEAPLPPKKPQKAKKPVENEDYWSLIYYTETPGNNSSELIRRLGEEGVFLVRDGQTGSSKVLVVFANNMPKKYRINCENERYSLVAANSFESVEELIYFYHSAELPCGVCLTMPYFKHPDYKP